MIKITRHFEAPTMYVRDLPDNNEAAFASSKGGVIGVYIPQARRTGPSEPAAQKFIWVKIASTGLVEQILQFDQTMPKIKEHYGDEMLIELELVAGPFVKKAVVPE